MEVAPVIFQAAAPQAERVRNPASQSFILHNSYPQPTHQATDSMATSLKSDPSNRTPVERAAHGSALRGAKSAHATSFSSTKVRPPRTENNDLLLSLTRRHRIFPSLPVACRLLPCRD